MGLRQSKSDPCLFSYQGSHSEQILLTIHVDDVFIAASSERVLTTFKDRLLELYDLSISDDNNVYLSVKCFNSSFSLKESDKIVQI